MIERASHPSGIRVSRQESDGRERESREPRAAHEAAAIVKQGFAEWSRRGRQTDTTLMLDPGKARGSEHATLAACELSPDVMQRSPAFGSLDEEHVVSSQGA